MDKETIVKGITAAGKGIGKILTNKDFQNTVLGSYSDGNRRSVADAIHGEYYSPVQKKKMDKKFEKHKKKKSKKIKKKDIENFKF